MNTLSPQSELRNLMKQPDAVFLSTIDADGFPITRAMLNLRNPRTFPDLEEFMSGTGNLFFTTNTSLPKVRQLRDNPHACAYFCIPSEWRGCAIQGSIEIINDRTVKKAIWQKGWTMYYPEGIDDPEYAVLCLTPEKIKGYRQLNHYTLQPEEM